MNYYMYRLKYDQYLRMTSHAEVPNELTSNPIQDGDHAIIIVSNSLVVLGDYVYKAESNSFLLQKRIAKVVTQFYQSLPMVSFVNQKTYKLFVKRIRQIDKGDYDAFVGIKS